MIYLKGISLVAEQDRGIRGYRFSHLTSPYFLLFVSKEKNDYWDIGSIKGLGETIYEVIPVT